ncbi:diacylglycerol/lipid kinase family protein [Leucobacter luti]|uniref:Diacylglycerol kinase family enzyme n=1 Tax=Leucobacter luti TaxID=340320 RepID=A0A4Q7U5A5_9MICO|nr:diacylglycerol kinase family protein [Leucobacter luti]MBL3700933.1 diacylglycerol kinase family lipid kinase [Leucobacter luti]RZT68846.1 diacylglycerol kinase family enzyme [Leucobacter luti]
MTDTPQPRRAPQRAAAEPALTRNTPLLLVSPVSGGGRGLRALPAVHAALEAAGLSPVVHHSASLADAADRVRRAGPDALVIALGGDGLIGAAAGAVAKTGALLLPLPGGRGNDTSRRFGLGLDPVAAAAAVATYREHRIDLAWVTTADGPAAGGRGFLGVCATGLDGVANELGNGIRLKLGPLTYIAGALLALFRFTGANYTVTSGGATRRGRAWLVAISNHGQYGGGVRISPDSRIDDGTLEVVGLWGGGFVRLAAVLISAFRGAHLRFTGVRVESARTVTIDADHPLGVFVDGERVGTLPATVTVRPGALRVLAGPRAEALGGA